MSTVLDLTRNTDPTRNRRWWTKERFYLFEGQPAYWMFGSSRCDGRSGGPSSSHSPFGSRDGSGQRVRKPDPVSSMRSSSTSGCRGRGGRGSVTPHAHSCSGRANSAGRRNKPRRAATTSSRGRSLKCWLPGFAGSTRFRSGLTRAAAKRPCPAYAAVGSSFPTLTLPRRSSRCGDASTAATSLTPSFWPTGSSARARRHRSSLPCVVAVL